MIIEYLFNMNPTTLFFLMLGGIFAAYKVVKASPTNLPKIKYDATTNDFKVIKQLNESDKANSILIVSYNILSYNFTRIEWYPYCQSEYLHPKYRAPRIMNEFEQINADIITMQECDLDLFNEYYNNYFNELGYVCHYNTKSHKAVTNAIAYKKDKFTLEKQEYLNLNEELGSIDESFIKHKEATILKLRHIPTGKLVVVVTTHIFWNPEYEYVKYGQVGRILTYVEKNYPGIPVLLGSDMNSLPKSNVLRYIYKLSPEYETKGDDRKNKLIDTLWKRYPHSLNLRSAYDVYKVDLVNEINDYASNHPEFTTLTHDFSGTLDYILYSSDKMELIELLKVPTNDEEVKALKLPNYRYPSDHLKIGARLIFK